MAMCISKYRYISIFHSKQLPFYCKNYEVGGQNITEKKRRREDPMEWLINEKDPSR